MERENLHGAAKGKGTSGAKREAEIADAFSGCYRENLIADVRPHLT
jgi:hypothetical protein